MNILPYLQEAFSKLDAANYCLRRAFNETGYSHFTRNSINKIGTSLTNLVIELNGLIETCRDKEV